MTEMTEMTDDLVTLLQANSAAFGDAVLATVRAEIGPDIRFSDGYVFQHLLVGPCTVTGLAVHLGISQQAASKQVADLIGRGLATKHRSPDDGRAWLVQLTPRAQRCVDVARRARSQIHDECAAVLGQRRFEVLVEALSALGGRHSALEDLLARRLKPETSR